MAEEISSPLLSLIKEQGLIDDLQYEEVTAEIKRSGTSAFQILQDFGILDMDSILQAMANHLSTEVVSLRNRDLSDDVVGTVPANTARMYRCVPVDLNNGTLRVAFEDPLDPAHVDEVAYVVKKDVQVVVANPAEIESAIEKYYGAEASGDVTAILK